MNIPYICGFVVPKVNSNGTTTSWSWDFCSKHLSISRDVNTWSYNFWIEYNCPIEGRISKHGILEDEFHFAKLFKWLLKKKNTEI